MAHVTPGRRVPTVDDLRVKLCYICREEETQGQTTTPPRRWVHPCKCSLVAHEACLLEWIRSSELNPSKADTIIKCPQCGTEYEWDSNNPLVLRIMDNFSGGLQIGGKIITILAAGAVVFSFGAGIYILATGYGAFAIHSFVGEEMYDMLLTDDPGNWPIMAWLNLPLIPLSLILGQTPMDSILPLFPLVSFWPSVPPAALRSPPDNRLLDLVFNRPGRRFFGPLYWAVHDMFFSWPPSPLACLFGLAFLKRGYKRLMTYCRKRILGENPVHAPARVMPLVRRLMFENFNFEMRIEGDDLNGAPQNNNAAFDQDPPAPVDQPQGQAQRQGAEEITIHLTGATIGRMIGGALLLPPISNLFGGLLFRLSKHSSLLRQFLSVRPKGHKFPRPPGRRRIEDMGILEQTWVAMTAGVSIFSAGSPSWREADPVWWRNGLGIGIWILARDCMSLWHEWMAQRELRSRHLKSRPFDDVDPAELDLLESSNTKTSKAG